MLPFSFDQHHQNVKFFTEILLETVIRLHLPKYFFMRADLILRFLFSLVLLLTSSNIFASTIENVNVSGEVRTAKVSWNINYDSLSTDKKIIIRYIPSNLAKLDANPPWEYTELIDSKKTSFVLESLNINEKYKVSVGLVDGNNFSIDQIKDYNIDWSKNKSFKTERGWTLTTGLIMRLLMLFGALALFIYGMKTMSEGIQKAAGQKLREILGAITKNRIKGIFTGFLTTTIIQSSSATTVMVVSFVNAGLLSLKQSISVVMGANIGTTVTAWIVAYLGFSVSMSDYALPILLFALIMLFSSRGNIKSWGEMLIGFAILFIGLELLKSGVPDVKGNVESLQFLKDLSGHGVFSVIMFVLIGTIVTIVVQSSSAAMAITILLCERGIIPFEMALGMVLGENIGTTITANLAAIVGNVHAKRAARAHLVFNVFGVTWMVIAFPWFIQMIDYMMIQWGFPSPFEVQASRPIALALFHTIFNILNVLMLVWFTKQIADLVIKMVPTKSTSDEDFRLDYISRGLLVTPELFLLEAQKELAKFGKITSKMSPFVQQLVFEQDKKQKKKLYSRIQKYEEITDRVELEISKYLSDCAENELSKDSALRVRGMLAITNELERIGDIFYQMSLTVKRKEEQKIWFTTEQRQNVKLILTAVDEAFEVMIDNLKMPKSQVTIDKALKKENQINDLRNKLKLEHLATIEKNEFNIKSGIIYTDLIYSSERIGDHIINITEALIGENLLGE